MINQIHMHEYSTAKLLSNMYLVVTITHIHISVPNNSVITYTYGIYPYRSPGIYFLKTIIEQAFIWALFTFYIGMYLLYSAEPLHSFGPRHLYESGFIQINTVHKSLQDYIVNSLTSARDCWSSFTGQSHYKIMLLEGVVMEKVLKHIWHLPSAE